jgi:hypothetical protein
MLIHVFSAADYGTRTANVEKMGDPDMTICAQLGESVWDQINDMFVYMGKEPVGDDISVVLFGQFGRKHDEYVAELKKQVTYVRVVP